MLLETLSILFKGRIFINVIGHKTGEWFHSQKLESFVNWEKNTVDPDTSEKIIFPLKSGFRERSRLN